MTNKFLGIGINKYPRAPLFGCVNDIRGSSEDIVNGWEGETPFKLDDLRTCTDIRAHAFGMKTRILQLVKGAKPGDRILFWYSGHGAQAPIRDDHTGEIDGLMELLCPVDFSFDDPKTWIRDDFFAHAFGQIPEGCNCTVVLDSCFSGGMVGSDVRVGASGSGVFRERGKPREYPLTDLDFETRMRAANARGLSPKPLIIAERMPNVTFLLGTSEDQTGADALIYGKYRGAFSYYLWEAIKNFPKLRIDAVVAKAGLELSMAGFSQKPRAVGANLDKPFMWSP